MREGFTAWGYGRAWGSEARLPCLACVSPQAVKPSLFVPVNSSKELRVCVFSALVLRGAIGEWVNPQYWAFQHLTADIKQLF